MKIKRFLSIPVFAVIFSMGFVYYSTVFIFIEELYGLKSSDGFFNALVFTCSAFMCLASFFSCLVMDPGCVPSDFVPEMEEGEVSENGSMKKNDSNLRYCDKCSAYKPPRTHHCRVCKRCVLKMDHHCLWMNNCVGFSNYKPFIVFILYAAISCIYSMVVTITVTLQKDWEPQGWSSFKIYCFTCGLVTIGLSLTTGTLLFWHIYLLTHNLTTIEYHEGTRAKWLARKSGKSYHHPFDLGVYRNTISILGPNLLKWFCPTAPGHLRDGLSFPISKSSS